MKLYDRLRERQAETCSLVAALQRSVDLNEWFEHSRNVFASHSDAFVGHTDFNRSLRHIRNGEAHPTALVRELHGVREEIEKRLLDEPFVGPDGSALRQFGQIDFDLRLECSRLVYHHRSAAHGSEIDCFLVQFHMAGIDLCKVEQIVDDGEEMSAATVDVRHVVKIAVAEGAEGLRAHQLGKSDDGIEWRSKLMARIRQEFRLRPARLFSLLLGFMHGCKGG